jgi:hypothetical protein
LINVKKLNDEQSFETLKKWLEKCDNLRKLAFNLNTEIKNNLIYVKHYKPISIKTLGDNNKKLYSILRKKL